MDTKTILKNYYAPVPQKMRKIGDAILFIAVAIQPMTMTLPLTDSQRLWIGFGLSVAGVIAKTITNFFTEEPAQPQPQP